MISRLSFSSLCGCSRPAASTGGFQTRGLQQRSTFLISLLPSLTTNLEPKLPARQRAMLCLPHRLWASPNPDVAHLGDLPSACEGPSAPVNYYPAERPLRKSRRIPHALASVAEDAILFQLSAHVWCLVPVCGPEICCPTTKNHAPKTIPCHTMQTLAVTPKMIKPAERVFLPSPLR